MRFNKIKKGQVTPPKLRSEVQKYYLFITRHNAIFYILKKALLITSLLLLCFSLAGCHRIPVRLGDKAYRINESSIEMNGKHYIKLPAFDALDPLIEGDIDSPWLYNRDGSELEQAILVSEDKSFLKVAEYEGEADEERVEYLYCVSDLYDEIIPVIKNGYIPDRYFYTVYTVKDGKQSQTEYTLTIEQTEALNGILASGEHFTSTDYRALFFIDSSYKEGLFGMRSDVMIAEHQGEAVIIDYDGGTKQEVYLIADEYKPTIEELISQREEQKNEV
ncbi:MAG: hypothetical protein IKT46_00375 [Clostridia bacterium]|nr:hypothetical protein [Clostridia bacterium]